MTYRDARIGGAVAGALLLAMPLLDVLYGTSGAGPLHFVVGGFGAALIGWSGRLR